MHGCNDGNGSLGGSLGRRDGGGNTEIGYGGMGKEGGMPGWNQNLGR